jgi:hypothetical protein
MKKINLLFAMLFLFSSIQSIAQKRLTNREIYNFEAGDVVHTMYQFQGPPKYVKRLILSKDIITNQDTFYFEVLDTIYELKQIPDWEMKIETHVIKYINLDSFPLPNDQNWALLSYQLTYSDFNDSNNMIVNLYQFSNAPDSVTILDREYYNLNCHEGLGCYYANHFQNNTMEYFELEYFNKGGFEWGKMS